MSDTVPCQHPTPHGANPHVPGGHDCSGAGAPARAPRHRAESAPEPASVPPALSALSAAPGDVVSVAIPREQIADAMVHHTLLEAAGLISDFRFDRDENGVSVHTYNVVETFGCAWALNLPEHVATAARRHAAGDPQFGQSDAAHAAMVSPSAWSEFLWARANANLDEEARNFTPPAVSQLPLVPQPKSFLKMLFRRVR